MAKRAERLQTSETIFNSTRKELKQAKDRAERDRYVEEENTTGNHSVRLILRAIANRISESREKVRLRRKVRRQKSKIKKVRENIKRITNETRKDIL